MFLDVNNNLEVDIKSYGKLLLHFNVRSKLITILFNEESLFGNRGAKLINLTQDPFARFNISAIEITLGTLCIDVITTSTYLWR